MRPIEVNGSNLRLVLEAGEAGKPERTLPATRLKTYDPDRGETEKDAVDAIATAWQPSGGELKALVNGALVELVVTGSDHPPVTLKVGEPPEEGQKVRLLEADVVDRAVGAHFAILSKRIAAGAVPEPAEVLEIWTKALDVAKHGPEKIMDWIEEAEAELRALQADDVDPEAGS